MRKMIMVLIPLMAIVALTGCEWSSGGDSSWTDTPNWVNFNGVYRGLDGGVLVTDYTTIPGNPGSTNNASRTIGTGNGGSIYSNMSLGYDKINPGSVTVDAAGYVFTDDGSGVLVGSVSGTGGSVNYGTGRVNIDLGNLTLASGEPINATFQYVVEGNQGSGSAGSGASGIVIYTFTVHHQGNKLTITDNNGSVYKGKFGNVETTSGGQGSVTDAEGNVTPATGTVVGQFSAEGVSAAGVNVKMTGTMQGELGGAGGSFTDRIMLGTWIEDPGRTGDIQAYAAPVAVDTTTTTN